QLYAAGDVEQAVRVVARALESEATPDAKLLFARYAGALHDGAAAEPYRDVIIRAVSEGWTRTSELARVSVLLIKRNGAISRLIGGLPAIAWDDMATIAEDRLLRAAICTARMSDADIERLLTAARRLLLDAAARPMGMPSTTVLEFAC